ncbi:MAG: urocanate hydratase [Acidobacteria bacterium]|nr:urocanate hydratase [Acidobacteriota bacterium]
MKGDQSSSASSPIPEGGARTAAPPRAPRGPQISCKGWQQEAALRLLMNTCDPEVSVPFAGREKVHSLFVALQSLGSDQTLIVRAGNPPGIVQSDPSSPRVLILNDMGPQEKRFSGPERWGRFLFGAAADESWTSAGAQSAVWATFATFARAAQTHFASSLAGKLVVAGGMGATGGAQPLAATMNGAAFLGIEADEKRILGQTRSGYCDICVNNLDEALRILKNAVRQKQPVSVGLVGNCVEVIPELARRGVVPDLLTDQTGALDLGYIPTGLNPQQAAELRESRPQEYLKRARESIELHVGGMLELQKLGAATFDFGNGIFDAAGEQAAVPHFATAYLQPLLSAAVAPVRWFALSGERDDIFKMDEELVQGAPQNEILARWLRMARKHLRFQGLPARVAWLGPDERLRFGERVNAMVARGELRAPVVISRDFASSTMAPLPGPEGRFGVVGGPSPRAVLEALREAASGASWAAFQCGPDNEAPQAHLTTKAAVAEGTPEAAQRLKRVLACDSGIGAA